MKYLTSFVVFLAVLWWILSGYTKPLLLSLGVVSIAFTTFMSYRMKVVDEESHPTHVTLKLIRLWMHLIADIVRGNIMVARIILGLERDFRPRFVEGPVRQDSELGRVVLANSITLSPGSATMDIREDFVVAHAINDQAAHDIESGDMDAWVSRGLREDS